MKKIVLTGGGTGGHIIPNIALIPELKKHFEIYYLGQENSLEQELISRFEYVQFVKIKSVKLIRKLTLKNILIPFKMLKYINHAKKILKKIKPDVIFAKGGYVSLPVVFAGKSLGIPILAHESDFSFGLANKIILKKCNLMFTSFRETCIGDKCVYSGSPVRDEIFHGDKNIAIKHCRFTENLPVILFFGGSQGSKKINQFVFFNINHLAHYNIIHIVGKGNLNKKIKRKNYYQIEYAYNIYDYFAYADVVICRAGSNSIFELLSLRKPMILIPLGTAQSRGDQIENAKIFKQEGYANVIYENQLKIQPFITTLHNTLKNKNAFVKNMARYKPTNANKLIISHILRLSRSS